MTEGLNPAWSRSRASRPSPATATVNPSLSKDRTPRFGRRRRLPPAARAHSERPTKIGQVILAGALGPSPDAIIVIRAAKLLYKFLSRTDASAVDGTSLILEATTRTRATPPNVRGPKSRYLEAIESVDPLDVPSPRDPSVSTRLMVRIAQVAPLYEASPRSSMAARSASCPISPKHWSSTATT